MSSSAVTIELCERSLSGAVMAHALIRRIANHLHAHQRIVLDFTEVERFDPQFAEQTFGPLAATFGWGRLASNLTLTGAADFVVRSIAEAIYRNDPRSAQPLFRRPAPPLRA